MCVKYGLVRVMLKVTPPGLKRKAEQTEIKLGEFGRGQTTSIGGTGRQYN
jgi:hypothetical protein